MGRELFLDFLQSTKCLLFVKKKTYILKMDDENAYVLKEGVVKVSVLMVMDVNLILRI